MDKFKINIAGLKDGDHNFGFEVYPDEIDLDEVRTAGNIGVNIRLTKTGNQIDVLVKLKGKYELDCDLCTEKYEHGFDNAFEIIYKYEFRDNVDVEVESDEEIKFIHPNTKHIDLKNDIRDFLYLAVPMKRTPDVTDGKCTFCGKDVKSFVNISRDEEVNPVWEKLIKAKIK